jgi:hypothetical protein
MADDCVYIPMKTIDVLMRSHLGGTEWSCVAAILGESTKAKSKEVAISQKEFSERTKRDIESIRDSLKTLQQKKIIEQTRAATFNEPARWRMLV